jgi:hypothetical protein
MARELFSVSRQPLMLQTRKKLPVDFLGVIVYPINIHAKPGVRMYFLHLKSLLPGFVL